MKNKAYGKKTGKNSSDTAFNQPVDCSSGKKRSLYCLDDPYMFKALLKYSPAAIMILDRDCRVIKWSAACETVFGWSEEEVIGSFPPVISEDKESQFRMLLEKGLCNTSFVDMQLHPRNKDGLVIDISLSTAPLRGEGGKILGFLGIMLDTSERRREEEMLRKSEETFRLIFDQSLFGAAILFTTDNRFLRVNQQLCYITGFSDSELTGRDIFSIIHSDDITKACQIINAVCAGDLDNCRLPVRCLRKDGCIVWVQFSAQIIRSEECEADTYYLLIIEDITQRKLAQEQLKKQESVLEQKNAALKELIGQVKTETQRMKDDLRININSLLDPVLKQLMLKGVPRKYTNLIYKHLEYLTSSFGRNITEKTSGLTPREIEICSLIKGGLTSKEISGMLNVSYQTVEKHRKNIRKKLKINTKSINLTSYLQNI